MEEISTYGEPAEETSVAWVACMPDASWGDPSGTVSTLDVETTWLHKKERLISNYCGNVDFKHNMITHAGKEGGETSEECPVL